MHLYQGIILIQCAFATISNLYKIKIHSGQFVLKCYYFKLTYDIISSLLTHSKRQVLNKIAKFATVYIYIANDTLSLHVSNYTDIIYNVSVHYDEKMPYVTIVPLCLYIIVAA